MGDVTKAHRRHVALGSLALAAVAATVLLAPPPGSSQSGPPAVGPLPLLGTADAGMTLMGAAPTAGETWGYRELPLTVDRIDGSSAGFGPIANPLQPAPQLAFLRHTSADGWRVAELPQDEQGAPYRGMTPNRISARVTPHGGTVLAGRDTSRPVGSQAVILRRDPGGRFRLLDQPPADVLLPAAPGQPAEALAEDQGSGRIAIAAFDEGAATGLLVAPTGRDVADGVLHFDGSAWTREDVDVPSGSETDFQILAIDATDADNAWALAATAPALGRGIVLLQRTGPPGDPHWVERSLGATPFADRDTPGLGIAGLAPLGGTAQPLTVTADGVWIDAAATVAGAARDITLYFDSGSGAVTGSWCDDAVCTTPLGARFSRQGGYRSFAWPGTGFGARVITNPLDVSGAEDSNRGAYLRLTDGVFARMPGGGGNFRPSGAFANADSGWLEGPVEVSASTAPARLRPWPISLRAPLADVATEPNSTPGALGSGALAVGVDGGVARYVPGRGWRREFLLSSSGSVNRSTLRGVAWPEASRAHAVGDLGAMWQWNADDGLWSADPGIPIGFEGNLLDVAFQPGGPDRGYAVGKGGVLLAYGKSWEQEPLPAGFESADLTSIAFAGRQAIAAAGGDLLVDDGGGWRVDSSAHDLLAGIRAGRPQLFAVAGLPDGGAVAAGRDIVLKRERAGAPWTFTDQPLPGSTAIAVAATRPGGGALRAVVSVIPQLSYPPADDLPEPDPNVPPPILPPFQLPGDGYLLRETNGGWRDEQRNSFSGSSADRPLKSDPVLGLLLDAAGNGWAVGGWSGDSDAAGRGSSSRNGEGRAIRARVRTAGIYRYGDDAAPQAASASGVPLATGPVRFAVAGHAQCDAVCADLAPQSIGPDRTLGSALRSVAAMHAAPGGPRALLYTGNRVKGGLSAADGSRYAQLLAGQPGLPVFPALGSSDVAADAVTAAAVFRTAFGAFPAPFGGGPAAAGISATGIPGTLPGSGARTHYAFDSEGPDGRVRVVVIDNSLGSLAASDAHQNPAEPQLPWLTAVLDDARAEGVPAIVMGNRDLNTRFTPKLNVASDGDQVARLLVDHGASAYVYDRPEENRVTRIPAAATQTIPSYGTGTLGYRSPIAGAVGSDSPDSLFGESGVLLLEVRADRRDPATNRAPVNVRMVPIIEDLSLEATDGTLLRRSRPALFRGLGRKPRGGDRWGRASAGSGNPDPAGGDPYTSFPPDQCLIAGCSARIAPEYSFSSSDPDIADFVLQDPNSTNLRKPLIGPGDKVVSANASTGATASAKAFASQSAAVGGTSGLLCPFNAGTTTVTVSAGGFSYSEPVTVLDGSVQRPCGTRPLRPDRFKRAQPQTAPPAPPPPGPAPAGGPPLNFEPPPLAFPTVLPAAVAPPTPPIAALPLVPIAAAGVAAAVPAIVPPPPPPIVRPMPPGGAPARTYQVEEKREEEAAIEESNAFSRYTPDDGGMTVPPYLPALVLLLAAAGAGLSTRRGRPRPTPQPVSTRRSRP